MGFQYRQYALEEQPENVQSSIKMAEKRYCICRSTDDSGFMILCEHCDEWFHGQCINVTSEESVRIETYYCKLCTDVNPDLKIQFKRSAMKIANLSYKEIQSDEEENTENGLAQTTRKLYYVGDILEKRIMDGQVQYFVKWADYDSTHNSWEPEPNLASAKDMVDRFEKKLRRQNGEISASSDDEDVDYKHNDSGSGSADSEESSSSEDEATMNGNGQDQNHDSGTDDEESTDPADADGVDGEGEDDEDDDDGDDDDDDDDEDEDDDGQPPGEFCLLHEIPTDKTPTKLLLTLPLWDGNLCYMIECKNKDDELEPLFVHANFFREEYPELLIDFYEKHVQFSDHGYSNDTDIEDCSSSSSQSESEAEIDTEPINNHNPPIAPMPLQPIPGSTHRRSLSDGSASSVSSSSETDSSGDSDDEVLAKKIKFG